jgi:hypothetical protein
MLAIATASTVVVFFFLLCFIVQNLPSKRTEQHSDYCGFVDCLLCVTGLVMVVVENAEHFMTSLSYKG